MCSLPGLSFRQPKVMWRATVWKLHIGEIPRLDLCAIAVWGVSLGVLATHRAESRRRATEGEVLASVLTLHGAAAGFLPGPPSSMDGPVVVWVFQKAFQAGLRVAEGSIDALRETSPHHSSLQPTTLQLTLQPLLSPPPHPQSQHYPARVLRTENPVFITSPRRSVTSENFAPHM